MKTAYLLSLVHKLLMRMPMPRQLPTTPDRKFPLMYLGLSFTYPTGITSEELGVIKLTAQFVARYGIYFIADLQKRVVTNPRFNFMKPSSSRSRFFTGLATAYGRVLKLSKGYPSEALGWFFYRLQLEKLEEGDEMAVIDLHAFVSGVDCFAHTDDEDYSARMPQPAHLSTLVNPGMLVQPLVGSQPDAPATHEPPTLRHHTVRPSYPAPITFPSGITLEELGVIKLTAQFVVRYGRHFERDLMSSVVMNPRFDFMKPTDRRSGLFDVLVLAYAKVLIPFKKMWKRDACNATVLECLFDRLQKLEEGAEMADMIDLDGFVRGVDCFAHMDDPDYFAVMPAPRNLSAMITQMQPGMLYDPASMGMTQPAPTMHVMSPPPPLPLPEEPEPGPNDSALVPGYQFLSQHPGSYTIRVSVPNAQDIEIRVVSLSQNVARLKEKIAEEIEIPANKQRLSGKAGVLEDHMSLEHYNVGPGETLTLSF